MKLRRRLLWASIATLLGLAIVEGLLHLYWQWAGDDATRPESPRAVEFMEDFHARHDADLGWAHIPGKQIADFYGPGRHITINDQGLRARESYAPAPVDGRFRILCLGDSFTLGYGVDDRATYPAQLEAVNPGLQAVNMGQGGYSIGQCYLWYQRDADALHAKAVVVALILDDIWRMTGGRMANGAAMPRFDLVGGRLHVTGRPVPKKIAAGEPLDARDGVVRFLSDYSAIYRTAESLAAPWKSPPLEIDPSRQLNVAWAILAELHRETALDGLPLVIVLLPELAELKDSARRDLYRQISRALNQSARQAGIPFLDLAGSFLAAGNVDDLYLDEQWHHFSELGNRRVAERLDEFLGETLPGYPSRPEGVHLPATMP
ncbi:MAG: hypothetical protein KF708_02825 [Pirellulales bacterium]|nr:hypothetical protein [Pirellulales bacterium]